MSGVDNSSPSGKYKISLQKVHIRVFHIHTGSITHDKQEKNVVEESSRRQVEGKPETRNTNYALKP